jgi:hypothetical protein
VPTCDAASPRNYEAETQAERIGASRERAIEPRPVLLPQRLDPAGLVIARASRPEQNGAERGHRREREHERADERERIRERERPEDPTLDGLQREHRQQRHDDDAHRVERRPADVDHGTHYELEQRLARLRRS